METRDGTTQSDWRLAKLFRYCVDELIAAGVASGIAHWVAMWVCRLVEKGVIVLKEEEE